MRTRGALAGVALWQVTTHSSPTAKSTGVDHCPAVIIERGVLDTTVGANPDTASEPTPGMISLPTGLTAGANSVVVSDPVAGVTLTFAVATTVGANSEVVNATVPGVTSTGVAAAA